MHITINVTTIIKLVVRIIEGSDNRGSAVFSETSEETLWVEYVPKAINLLSH